MELGNRRLSSKRLKSPKRPGTADLTLTADQGVAVPVGLVPARGLAILAEPTAQSDGRDPTEPKGS